MNYFRCGGSEKVTIDGEKVRDKMELQSFVIDYLDYASIPYPVQVNFACALNNELHILCVNKAHYKWDGRTWTQVSTLPYIESGNCVTVFNGEIHAFGRMQESGSGVYQKHYKWDGETWIQVSVLPYNFNFGSVVVMNDELYIAGGRNPYNSSQIYNKLYKWDGTTWTEVSTVPYSFYNGAMVVLNDEIHVFGGYGKAYDYETPNYTNLHYVRSNNVWVRKADLPYPMYNFSAIMLDGEIHALGGVTVVNSGDVMYEYTKHFKWTPNSWNTLTPLPSRQANSSSAVVLNGKIHVLQTDKQHYVLNPTVYNSP